MDVVISYDLYGGEPDGHPAVKKYLLNIAYKDFAEKNGLNHNLPETTLWRSEVKSLQDTYKHLEEAIKSLNVDRKDDDRIRIKRFFAWELVASFSIPGDAHAPNP